MISIIMPLYNDKAHIRIALDSLTRQAGKDYEVIVVDDCSKDGSYEIAKSYNGIRVLRNKKNRGPAFSRNRGIKAAKGNSLLFTDSDCIIPKDWTEGYKKAFAEGKKIVQGKVIMPKSNYLGDSISALGFPAGGSLGFDKMWPVAKDGSTMQLVTCNCGIKKEVFDKCGLFDETFPYPFGEDTEMGHRAIKKGFKIIYTPSITIKHPPRNDFKSFTKWAYKRGLGGYHLAKRVNMKDTIKMRLWSAKNVLLNGLKTRHAPIIILLFFLYNMLQQIGFAREAVKFKLRS